MNRLPPLRAPSADGAVLAVPPLEEAGRLIAANLERVPGPGRHLLGRRWSEVRAAARRELLELATAYMTARGEPVPGQGAAAPPWLLAGHQPELFHPGVWAKNFALAGLARRHRGVSVNLIVDNDTVKSTSLRVPVPGPSQRVVPFDRWQGQLPWEARHVLDPAEFAAFGEQVTDLMRQQWGIEPLVQSLWPRVRELVGDGPVGEAFAGARREVERAWGCHNLEVPLSRVCRGRAFAHFAAALLADLPRLIAVYNGVTRAYRRRNGIRSRNHPVPDLAAEPGGWLEAPLWGWRLDRPRRRGRLFVRQEAGRLEVRAGDDIWPSLPPPEDEAAFLDAWQGLAAQGLAVRSRALVTTLFARLVLSDLFLHGIGGGKYDELTDEIMRQFFGVEPPAYLVLTATRWLPLPAPDASPAEVTRLERLTRDIEYNPQRHLSEAPSGEVAALVRRKGEWIAWQPQSPDERRERFRQLRAVNDQLRPAASAQAESAAADLADARGRLAARSVLLRRDYSFCLYPEKSLRSLLTALL